MKKLLAVFILLPFISLAQTGEVCILEGHISGLGDGLLGFYHSVDDPENPSAKDTVRAHNGDFTFTARLTEPTCFHITYYVPKTEKKKAIFYQDVVFLQNGNMAIKGKLAKMQKAVVKGSDVNDEWEKVSKVLKAKEDSLAASAVEKRGSKDKKKNAQIELNKEEQKVLTDYIKTYVIAHRYSYVSLQLMRDGYGYDVRPAESAPLFKCLDDKVRNTVAGRIFQHKLDAAMKTDTGQPAIEVSLPDSSGKNISLSSLRGKVVLLDFWASWCGPCRRENPNVVKVYHKYHDKGFDIYGVSFDQKKEAWLQAIAKDSLTWTHVSDLKGWQCAAGKLYYIEAIPSNVLIDRNGIIIAKNLHGEDLEDMLEKVLK